MCERAHPSPIFARVEAFKRTLLEAKSITYNPEGSGGKSLTGLLERLGIAADVQAKYRTGGVQSAANGEAELVIAFIPIIVAARGVELVGPFPPGLQVYFGFTAGIGTSAEAAEAGEALINFLRTPEAALVIRAKGMEPAIP